MRSKARIGTAILVAALLIVFVNAFLVGRHAEEGIVMLPFNAWVAYSVAGVLAVLLAGILFFSYNVVAEDSERWFFIAEGLAQRLKQYEPDFKLTVTDPNGEMEEIEL